MTASLEARLLAAHAAGDAGGLVGLYAEAADGAAGPDAAAFFLMTHAYVHALEAGDARAAGLHARLRRAGREE